jgi:pimeloyl-ACP methyl ester carboxylesterase
MEAVLDTLHLDRPVVLSPSMSGSFSFPLATQRADRLRGYVPIAPVGIARYSPQFKQITVPTFIVWGTHDNVIPFDQAFVLERGIPDSEILILKGARHPCYLDDPETFHKGLLYFLEKLKENGD